MFVVGNLADRVSNPGIWDFPGFPYFSEFPYFPGSSLKKRLTIHFQTVVKLAYHIVLTNDFSPLLVIFWCWFVVFHNRIVIDKMDIFWRHAFKKKKMLCKVKDFSRDLFYEFSRLINSAIVVKFKLFSHPFLRGALI